MTIKDKILELANTYSENLKTKMDVRVAEMEQDNNSHYLIYNGSDSF